MMYGGSKIQSKEKAAFAGFLLVIQPIELSLLRVNVVLKVSFTSIIIISGVQGYSGTRANLLPVRTSGRRVQNSARKPEGADDIMHSARVQIHIIHCMSTQ